MVGWNIGKFISKPHYYSKVNSQWGHSPQGLITLTQVQTLLKDEEWSLLWVFLLHPSFGHWHSSFQMLLPPIWPRENFFLVFNIRQRGSSDLSIHEGQAEKRINGVKNNRYLPVYAAGVLQHKNLSLTPTKGRLRQSAGWSAACSTAYPQPALQMSTKHCEKLFPSFMWTWTFKQTS